MKLFSLTLFATLFRLFSFAGEFYRGELLQEKLKQESLAPLEGKCRIILLRHGETAWNAKGKKQGWTDIPLNEKGKEQAKALGDLLSDINVTTFYASALSRTTETAEIIATSHEGAKVVPDELLRFFRKDKIRCFDFLKSKQRKKAEMFKEVTEDATAYLKNLSYKHPGETVIVVTHSRVIKYLLIFLGGYTDSNVRIKNGAFARFIGDGQTLSIEL